jgi:hypothetical protein
VHKKNGALEELIKIYENHTGKPTTNKKIMKMINNMKTRLKKKIDTKRTGNKKIIMKEYERIILKVMNGEQNPIITQIPGAKEVGSGESASIRNLLGTVMLTATSSALPEPEPISPVLIKRKRKNHVLSGNETQETSSLSNAELQRLVMLEQLKTLRTQRRFYQIQIENLWFLLNKIK